MSGVEIFLAAWGAVLSFVMEWRPGFKDWLDTFEWYLQILIMAGLSLVTVAVIATGGCMFGGLPGITCDVTSWAAFGAYVYEIVKWGILAFIGSQTFYGVVVTNRRRIENATD